MPYLVSYVVADVVSDVEVESSGAARGSEFQDASSVISA
jgi:hypothetical protein